MTYIICTNEIANLVNSPGISKNDRNTNETIQERQSACQWGKYRTVRFFCTPQGASLEPMFSEEVERFDGNFNSQPDRITRKCGEKEVSFFYVGHFVDNNSHIIHLTYSD